MSENSNCGQNWANFVTRFKFCFYLFVRDLTGNTEMGEIRPSRPSPVNLQKRNPNRGLDGDMRCSLVLQTEKRVRGDALTRRCVLVVEQLQVHRPAIGTVVVGGGATAATGTRGCRRYIRCLRSGQRLALKMLGQGRCSRTTPRRCDRTGETLLLVLSRSICVP